MRILKIFEIVLAGAILCALPCFASDIYIAQSTQGADTGADAADAHSAAWFNTPANWGGGATQIGTGCTVHVCGIVSNPITFQAGGSAGNPITLLFEPNARFSAPTWNGVYVINGASDVTIDGGQNGIIEATANGTGLAYSNNCAAIHFGGCMNVLVKNLAIQNLYVNIAGPDEQAADHGGGSGIAIDGQSSIGIVVTNCTFHDMYVGVGGSYNSGCSNWRVTGCMAYNCNMGVEIGDANSSSSLTGCMIDHCHFYNWRNWDDSNDDAHHNGAYVFAQSGGSAANIIYACNYIGPGYGAHNTSGIFISGANIGAMLAYNNIFDASDGTAPSGAQLYISNYSPTTTNIVVNNTFTGVNAAAIEIYGNTSGGNNCMTEFYNNAVYNCAYAVKIFYGATVWNTSKFNTNNYYGSSSFSPSSTGVGGSGQPLSWWNAFSTFKFDANSTLNNPNLNGSWQPQPGSALIGAGMNLSQFFTTDYAGNPRPATGAWTIGAFAGAAAISNPIISVTPASQDFGAVVLGMTTNQTFTVQNTGGGMLTGSVSVAAPLSIVSNGSYSLGAGQSQTVTVSYSPTAMGTNVMPVAFSGGAGTSVMLTGTAVAPLVTPPQNLKALAPGP